MATIQHSRKRATAGMRLAVLACVLPALIAGCSMPRGAALRSEILRGTQSAESEIQVFEVTRASIVELDQWPLARPEARHHWVTTGAAPTARIIRSGDEISIAVWDSQPDSLLTTGEQRVVNMANVPVSASGHVFVPYVGELRVSGMSAEQARREIQQRLEPIVPDAQVQLNVAPGSRNTIDVVTGVANPGRQELPEISPTILSVLAEAGGISANLRNPLVRLNRAGASYAIPANELFSNPANDIQLRGGDRILVEEDGRSYIALGATGSEQVVYFEREDITALDALSTIGGLSDARADLNGLLVLREYPASALRETDPGPRQQQVVFTFDLTSASGLFAARNFMIETDDVVLASESPFPMFAGALSALRQFQLALNQ